VQLISFQQKSQNNHLQQNVGIIQYICVLLIQWKIIFKIKSYKCNYKIPQTKTAIWQCYTDKEIHTTASFNTNLCWHCAVSLRTVWIADVYWRTYRTHSIQHSCREDTFQTLRHSLNTHDQHTGTNLCDDSLMHKFVSNSYNINKFSAKLSVKARCKTLIYILPKTQGFHSKCIVTYCRKQKPAVSQCCKLFLLKYQDHKSNLKTFTYSMSPHNKKKTASE